MKKIIILTIIILCFTLTIIFSITLLYDKPVNETAYRDYTDLIVSNSSCDCAIWLSKSCNSCIFVDNCSWTACNLLLDSSIACVNWLDFSCNSVRSCACTQIHRLQVITNIKIIVISLRIFYIFTLSILLNF